MAAGTIDWDRVRRVLVIRLRSIGDTVLATPSLDALKQFLPHAQVDILLEDWVASVLEGFDAVDNVVITGRDTRSRLATAAAIRRAAYDVVFNFHGGSTSTLLTAASGAPFRIGYQNYRHSFFYTHLLSSSADFWGRFPTHSAEQQLALVGFAGVPVRDDLRSRLALSESAFRSLADKFAQRSGRPLDAFGPFALIHPTAAFRTKEWAIENFARVVEFLEAKGLRTIAVASRSEQDKLDELIKATRSDVITFHDLTLPEITAVASRASIFVGNDSGIAHIAAAVQTPSVVIFGSSDRDHWRPWTSAPNEIVFKSFACQPCPGFECKEFGEARCIQTVEVAQVCDAIDRVLTEKERAQMARSNELEEVLPSV